MMESSRMALVPLKGASYHFCHVKDPLTPREVTGKMKPSRKGGPHQTLNLLGPCPWTCQPLKL